MLSQASILIVDDLAKNLQVLANALKQNDYKIALATSAKQALEILEKTTFDLILMDISMPEMDGIEACRILKSNASTQAIPLIFLTAHNETEKIIEGFDAGAVDYITKPFDDKELIKRVETHIKLKKTTEELENLNRTLEERVKERTKELNFEKKRSEAANKAKTHFLANMNHELRTPLNSIMGFSSILSESELNEEQQNHLKIIQKSSEDLLKLISDILNYTDIETVISEIKEVTFNPEDLIEEIIHNIEIDAIRKGLHFSHSISGQITEVLADEVKIKQVLMILIQNAIKFTHEGEIKINAQFEKNKNKTNLVFEVADTGIGIEEDKLHLIFEEFYQVDEAFTRKYGGLGLGLSIAKEFATKLKGTINVSSKKNQGSVFTFMVPVNPVIATEEIKATALKINTSKNILVVEDNLMNQQLIRLVLIKHGFKVTIAENGLVGYNHVKENDYDLVLMDIQMPVMDGIEATKKIRELPNRKDLPIIAFTAHTTPTDREMCLDAGMNDMMNKPLRENILFEMMDRYCK